MNALIIVDVQNDFLPGGALPVSGGFEVIEPILRLAAEADTVVKTADDHPEKTKHFEQWPVHCVRGSAGARFPQAIRDLPGPVFGKGQHDGEDGYSGFTNRSLGRWLKGEGVTEVTVVGLALDYCVKETALDARLRGYEVTVDLGATRPVTEEGGAAAIAELEAAGAKVVWS